ncbi:MAG: c-type cytochrome, partial [Planctomycetaceae bacterium]|nr:c-type cytochrome [Planctomycetaceae bacterium]
SLSVGTGAEDFGPLRSLARGRKFTPRNAPEVFNRGLPEWRTMFWDSRVELNFGQFSTPAKDALPTGFTHVLQVQAMFPVTSRTEMRGNKGDRDVFGNINEIASIDDKDFPAIWQALMHRLLGPDGAKSKAVPSYRQLFREAFPKTPPDSLGFQHAAAAIAAYERSAYTLLDSPWDRYLQNESDALTPAAKRGAILFYGRANCVACHSGNLMTDQKHHNLIIPHIGNLAINERENDLGRARETKNPGDNYKFRTPPLRNVAETGPWMHNGLYTTLEGAIQHHLDPIRSFQNYDTRQLTMPELKDHVHNSDEDLQKQLATFSEILKTPRHLSKQEMNDLIQFLHALTSPSLHDLERNVPAQVPSGLLVD